MPESLEQPHRRRGKSGIILTGILLISVIVMAVRANMWKADMRVQEVVVTGNRIVAAGDILALAGTLKGQGLFDVDLFAIQNRVKNNTFVKGADVNRDVPDRVTITIQEREPVAIVALEKLLYLDEEGYVLPPARSEFIFDLPVLTGNFKPSEVIPGRQTSNAELREALVILALSKRVDDALYRRISEVHVERGKDILFYTAEYGVPVVFGRGDASMKLVKLDTFWREFVKQRGAAELSYVDLRFEGQVVARWNRTVDQSATGKKDRSPL